MADRSNGRTAGGAGKVARPRPDVLRVLPCIDNSVNSSYFAGLRSIAGMDVLPLALVSTLVFRVQSDQPDAIVIATEGTGTKAWWSGTNLSEALSLVPTVLLASEVNSSLKRRAERSNIHSVLPLDIGANQLAAAIRATVEGLAVSVAIPADEHDENNPLHFGEEGLADEALAEHLTARETEVLRLLALGHGNKEIAALLAISDHTAKFHVSSVLAKLGATSRTEAVTLGIMRGLVAI